MTVRIWGSEFSGVRPVVPNNVAEISEQHLLISRATWFLLMKRVWLFLFLVLWLLILMALFDP